MSVEELVTLLAAIAAVGRAYGPDVLAVLKWLQSRKQATPQIPPGVTGETFELQNKYGTPPPPPAPPGG